MQNRSSWLALTLAFCVLVAVGFSGGYVTVARFSDTEIKHVSITADISPPEVGNQPAISFVAFCVVESTSASASDVSITDIQYGNEGEPFAITYESTVELSTVVLKGAHEWENFDGGTSGTVVFGTGKMPESAGKPNTGAEQTPSSPCPSGETIVVKFEYNKESKTFESGTEIQSSVTTVGMTSAEPLGVQSVENTSPAVNANSSNVTLNATDSRAVNVTADQGTNTSINRDADSNATADRSASTNETSANGTHPLDKFTNENETTQSDSNESQ